MVTGEPAENVSSTERTAVPFIDSRAQVVRTKGLCDVDNQGCGKVHALKGLISYEIVHRILKRLRVRKHGGGGLQRN
jgi:hypothetical protein